MGRTTSGASAGLARSSASEQALAWHHRERLILAAATLVASVDHDPDQAGDGRSGFDTSVLDVAHRLARLPGGPSLVPTQPVGTASRRFAAALTAAADAVRHCRQTVHTGGGCWFSDDAGRDGCGEVLHLLHELG